MEIDYLPKDRNDRLFRIVEQCGEVMRAIGKAGRFGLTDPGPEGTNAQLILNELIDLKNVIEDALPDIHEELDRQA